MWVDFIAYHAEHSPERIARILEESERRLSYADLYREVCRQGAWLARAGISRGLVSLAICLFGPS